MRQLHINGTLWVNPGSYLNKLDAQSKANDYRGDGLKAMVRARKRGGRDVYDVYVTGHRKPRLSR